MKTAREPRRAASNANVHAAARLPIDGPALPTVTAEALHAVTLHLNEASDAVQRLHSQGLALISALLAVLPQDASTAKMPADIGPALRDVRTLLDGRLIFLLCGLSNDVECSLERAEGLIASCADVNGNGPADVRRYAEPLRASTLCLRDASDALDRLQSHGSALMRALLALLPSDRTRGIPREVAMSLDDARLLLNEMLGFLLDVSNDAGYALEQAEALIAPLLKSAPEAAPIGEVH